MHSLPSISGCSSTPELSRGSALEDRIAHARLFPVNYDDTRLMHDFKESSDFEAAVEQTLLGLHWMEDLLGVDPRWATIRAAFHPFVAAFSGDAPEHVEAQCRFLGQGKRCLYALCELLQGDPRPSTRERVVRSLERDLTTLDGTLPDPGDVLDRALEAARDPRREGRRPLTPTAPPMSLSPPPSRRVAAPASLAPQSIAPQRSMLEQARQQAHFYGDVDQTPAAFRAGLSYEPARRELFLLLQRLKSLLPETGPDQDVGRMIRTHAQAWVGDRHNFDDARAVLFGDGKRRMLAVCEALEANSGSEAQAAVCARLRGCLRGRQTSAGVVPALEQALVDLAGLDGPVASSLPEADNPLLAALLQQIGAAELQGLHRRLSRDFDRLIDLLPAGRDHATLQWLTALSDTWARPPARIDGRHTEMLVGGHALLERLHDELSALRPRARAEVFNFLKQRMPDPEHSRDRVAEIAKALVEAESLRAGQDNPHLDERRQRFRAWAATPHVQSTVTSEQLGQGLEALGLEMPDAVIDGPMPRMDPIRNNAAWLACLMGPGQAGTVPPLADVMNADLGAAIVGLKARCEDLIVADQPLGEFARRWLGRSSEGGQEDMSGNLRAFGAAAMDRLVHRLAQPGDRAGKQHVLARLLQDLSTTEDPAALLLRYARYELPRDPISAAEQEALDRGRRAVVEREVRKAASALLEGQAAAVEYRAVAQACRRVEQMLGIRAPEGDAHTPQVGGLLDVSPRALAGLDEDIRSAIGAPAARTTR